MAEHTVYAVASGKGGVGKTTTTVNLGAALAEQGYSVVLVDVDLGMANLGGYLGVDPDGQTLHEVLGGEAALEDAVYEVADGLAVVPSGTSLGGFADVETDELSGSIDALSGAFDYVLLDLGAGLSHDSVLPLALADAVLLVTTPQPLSLQDTGKTREITERLGGAVAGTVLTRARSPGDVDLDEVEDEVGIPVLSVIPEDHAVQVAADDGRPVVGHDPDSPAAEGYRGLAEIVIEESLAMAPVVPDAATTGTAGERTGEASEPGSESESEPEAGAESASESGSEPEPEAEPESEPEAESAELELEVGAGSEADAEAAPDETPERSEVEAEPTTEPATGSAAEPDAGVVDEEADEAEAEAEAPTEAELTEQVPEETDGEPSESPSGEASSEEESVEDESAEESVEDESAEEPTAEDIASAIEQAASETSDGVLTVDNDSREDFQLGSEADTSAESTDPDDDESDGGSLLGGDAGGTEPDSESGLTLSGGEPEAEEPEATGAEGTGAEAEAAGAGEEGEDEEGEEESGGLLSRLFGG